MHTPAHIVASLAVTKSLNKKSPATAAIWGAVIPDSPMYIFFAYEALWMGESQQDIWHTLYFQQGWQDFFDLFNSIPLISIGIFVAWRLKRSWWLFLFLSMMVHMILDLPLHAEDAHRHFYPFSNYVFQSPISYWDSQYYGNIGMFLELCVLVISVYTIWPLFRKKVQRGFLVLSLLLYILMFGAMILWM
jgi:membrane-bound metal-dependent hydrolase YbcI (DUF457 family)